MSRRRYKSTYSAGLDLPPSDRWLLSYADFVTLLLAVFIVLFASFWQRRASLTTVSTAIHSGFDALSAASDHTQAARNTGSALGPPQSNPLNPQPVPAFNTADLSKQLEGVLGDAIGRKEIVMQRTPDGLVISLRELGFFRSGEATLLPGAAEKLRATAEVLRQHGLEVRVEGHSDDQPIHTAAFDSNWQLSTARAMSVVRLLLDGTGFPPEQVSVAGYGPYHPVADNATAEGRRVNRRVDLVVIAPRSGEEKLR